MQTRQMKNNDLNRNKLRAISIGLAAAMTLMPSVSAFADDGEGGGDEKVKEELKSLKFNAELGKEIQALRDQISELKQKNRLTPENGGWALTELLLKYKLQKEGVDPDTVVLPKKSNGTVDRIDGNYADHRATLTYEKDGETKTVLVDWVAYIEKEDGSVTADTTGYSKDISYYDVVLKEVDENGNFIAGVKGSS